MTTAQLNTINQKKTAQLNFIYHDDITKVNYIGQQDGTLKILTTLPSGQNNNLGLLNSYIFVGDSSNFATGVPLTGDASINSYGALTLANTGVVPGTYGDSLNVSTTTVDSKGRITTILNTPIDLIISKTYAQITDLIASSSLQESCTYFISDKNVYLTATSSNSLSSVGLVKATNADYNNVTGNFIGVWTGTIIIEYDNLFGSFTTGEIITSDTSTAQAEIVRKVAINIISTRRIQLISTNGLGFIVGETIIGLTSGATATVVSVQTTSILGTIANNKIVSWNNLHYLNTTGSSTIKHPKYDTTNWTALPITDSSYQIEYDKITYNFNTATITGREDKRGNVVIDKETTPNSIDRFQWGRNATFGNNVFSFDFTNWNAATAQTNLLVQDSSCFISDKAAFSFSLILSRSTFNAFRDSDGLASDCTHSNLTMVDGNCRHIDMHNFADITVLDTTSSAADSEFRGCSLMLYGTSSISYCLIDGGTPSIEKVFINETHINKSYKRNVSSTFETTLSQLSGSTTMNLTDDIYGVYNVTVTGGAGSIDTIANIPTSMSVYLLMTGTNTLTVVHGATIKMKGAANKTFNPANEDWIELEKLNGIPKEINSGQY